MKSLLVGFLLCGVAWAGDGNWWRDLPSDMRLGYVIGFMDGRCSGGMHVLDALEPLSQKQMSSIPRCTFPPTTTYGQVRDAIDQFYENASNRLILTESAFDVVQAEIEGHPLKAERIASLRRLAAQSPTAERSPSPQPASH